MISQRLRDIMNIAVVGRDFVIAVTGIVVALGIDIDGWMASVGSRVILIFIAIAVIGLGTISMLNFPPAKRRANQRSDHRRGRNDDKQAQQKFFEILEASDGTRNGIRAKVGDGRIRFSMKV